MSGITGFDVDKLGALQAIAHNTKMIAEQLNILNMILKEKHTPIEYQLGEINKSLKEMQDIWQSR